MLAPGNAGSASRPSLALCSEFHIEFALDSASGRHLKDIGAFGFLLNRGDLRGEMTSAGLALSASPDLLRMVPGSNVAQSWSPAAHSIERCIVFLNEVSPQ